jgi:flagellar biosynthesis/type III secretory pathway protein FliH
MQKIEKGTHKGLFDWILESDNHATHPENNSAMIRALVQEHNKLIDQLEKQYQKGYEHGYDNGKEDSKIME